MDFKAWRNQTLHHILTLGQRAKVDLLPHHFYSSIPDLRDLRSRVDWRARRSMKGVDGLDLNAQLSFLRSLAFASVPDDVYERACHENGAVGYGPVEAAVLYAYVFHRRPAQIVQIGAGVSTAVILRALAATNSSSMVTCIDPFPTRYLRALHGRNVVRLLEEPFQEVEIEEMTNLISGDLVFVDSTHTVKPGSEVNRLILEVLPLLAKGVTIHFHDVTWPYDYPRDVLDQRLFFWEESTLLHAFLVNNQSLTVRACLSLLHYDAPVELQLLVPFYEPEPSQDGLRMLHAGGKVSSHFPSSVYLEVVSP